MTFRIGLLVFIGTLGLSGCSDGLKNYDKTVTDGMSSISSVAQFQELFPQAHHFISYYGGGMASGASPQWHSKTGIAGRYVLRMSIPIMIDRKAGRVTSSGTPSFQLNEVTGVSRLPDGRAYISYGRQIQFGAAEWDSFCARHGDLSVLGISTPGTPIADFEKYVDGA